MMEGEKIREKAVKDQNFLTVIEKVAVGGIELYVSEIKKFSVSYTMYIESRILFIFFINIVRDFLPERYECLKKDIEWLGL